jgi:hypothetical protein
MVLSTREALVALAEGKKIRPTHWPKKCYIVLTSDGVIVDNVMDREEFNSEHNYVLFHEVQTKHEGRKYLYQEPGHLHWHETPYYFNSDEAFNHAYPGVVNFVSLKEVK